MTDLNPAVPLALKHDIAKDKGALTGPQRRFPWVSECAWCGVQMRRPSHPSAVTVLKVHVATRHPEQFNRYAKESK